MRTMTRIVSVVLLSLGLLGASAQGLRPAVTNAPHSVAVPVEDVTGAGILDKAGCLACAIGIVGAGGLTFGGIIATALLYPDVVATCGFLCIRAL